MLMPSQPYALGAVLVLTFSASIVFPDHGHRGSDVCYPLLTCFTGIARPLERLVRACIHWLDPFVTYFLLLLAYSSSLVNAMPRFISASVDDSLYSTNLLRASELPFTRLSHAASAIELRGSRQPKYATARPRKSKGRRGLRAASSLPLSEASENAYSSISSSDRSGSKDLYSTSQSADYSGGDVPSPEYSLSDGGGSYPSPPASENTGTSTPSTENCAGEDASSPPFPLTPLPLLMLSPTTATDSGKYRKSRGRAIGTTAGLRTPSTSPDRYISYRYIPQDASKSFRLSKPPEQFSSTEKLLRHPSATPDPFGPLPVRRIREARINASANADPRAAQSRTRTIGTTNVQHPPQDPLATQNRQASAGAVWNVGGGSQANPSGPIRGVSDGRGGFISSGSNAPMFTSHFFDDDTLEQDNSQLESRLAVALDIDQTCRVLGISRSPVQGRSVSTGSIGTKRNYTYLEPRTRWMNDQWVQEGSQRREATLFLVLVISPCIQPRFRFPPGVIIICFTSFFGRPADVMRISNKETSEDRTQSCSNHTL